jgi:hypothetical protein
LHAFVQVSRGELERLPNILRLKFRLFAAKIIPVRRDGKRLNDSPHGKTHAADCGLPVENIRVGRDSVELSHGFCCISSVEIIPQAGRGNNGAEAKEADQTWRF